MRTSRTSRARAVVLIAVGELLSLGIVLLGLGDAALGGRDVQIGLQQTPGERRLVGDGQGGVIVADLDVPGVDLSRRNETGRERVSQVCAAASLGQNADTYAGAAPVTQRHPFLTHCHT